MITLQTAIDKLDEGTNKYKKTLSIDLSDLRVTPEVVQVVVWDPMFVFLQLLPLPPKRASGESVAEWIQRASENPPEDDVRWVYEPRFARGTDTRVYTGDSNCGEYFKRAMEVTVI